MSRSLKEIPNRLISMLWALPLLLIFVVILWGYISSSLIIKTPKSPLGVDPGTFDLEFEKFKLTSEDETRLEGWFIPSKIKTDSTIFVLHGWGANRSDILPATKFLANNYNLVYFDFRNHGTSGGNATSLTCNEIKDYVSVVKRIRETYPLETRRIAVFGFSMGAAVAISGSVILPEIKAIIAESPFASFNETVIRFARKFYGIPRWVVPLTLSVLRFRLGFDPEVCSPLFHVGKLAPRPVFILQAGADRRMPVTEGQGIYEMAKDPKEYWLVPGADHGEIYEMRREEYQKKILGFYQKWLN